MQFKKTSFCFRIINANAAVCFLDATDIQQQLQNYKTNLLLTEQRCVEESADLKNLKIRKQCELLILGRRCTLIQLDTLELTTKVISVEVNVSVEHSSRIFYCTTTSGTTGDRPKRIGVTYKCFMPNVLKLR